MFSNSCSAQRRVSKKLDLSPVYTSVDPLESSPALSLLSHFPELRAPSTKVFISGGYILMSVFSSVTIFSAGEIEVGN